MKSEIDNKYPGVNFEGNTIYMQAPFAAIVRSASQCLFFTISINKNSLDTQLGQAAKASPAGLRITAVERPRAPAWPDQGSGGARGVLQDKGCQRHGQGHHVPDALDHLRAQDAHCGQAVHGHSPTPRSVHLAYPTSRIYEDYNQGLVGSLVLGLGWEEHGEGLP